VERNAITNSELPLQDAVLRPLRFEIGRGSKRLSWGIGVGFLVHKSRGCEPTAPGMGPGDELNAGVFFNRVERNPQTDDVFAIDRVVGLVMVPGCALLGPRFFHQHMLVVQIDLGRSHQLGSQRAGVGMKKKSRYGSMRSQLQ